MGYKKKNFFFFRKCFVFFEFIVEIFLFKYYFKNLIYGYGYNLGYEV